MQRPRGIQLGRGTGPFDGAIRRDIAVTEVDEVVKVSGLPNGIPYPVRGDLHCRPSLLPHHIGVILPLRAHSADARTR